MSWKLKIYGFMALLSLLTPLGAASGAGARPAPDILVYALFQGKAVLIVDGKKRVLQVGEKSPEGITLVASDGESAVVDIDGRRERLSLATQLGSVITAPTQTEVQLFPDASGMYFANGSVNGQVVRFLVDTGATLIAMNGALAKRLGIDYRMGRKGTVETASGVEGAYGITLRSVKVGEIELRDVDAVVIDGGYPTEVLLGMSFLGRLEMQRDARHLLLRKKH